MTRGEEMEMKTDELCKRFCIGDSIKRISFINKLIVRIAFYELFLEDQELDARFKNWITKRHDDDRRDRGLPKAILEWR